VSQYSAAWDDPGTNWDDPAVSWEGYGAGILARITVEAGADQATVVGTPYPVRIIIKAYDGLNNPMPGVITAVFAPAGAVASGTFPDGTNAYNGVTDADGAMVCPVFTANSIAGTLNMRATALATPSNLTVQWTQRQVADVPAAVIVTNGDNQSVQVDSPYAGLACRVEDRFTNPCAGLVVSWSAPTRPGASASWPNGVTTVTGITTFTGAVTAPTGLRANLVAGAFQIAVSCVGATNAYACFNLAGPPLLILAVSGTPQSTPVDTTYQVPFGAIVTDQYGNGGGGHPVTFTAPAGAPSGTFANGTRTETVTTGIDGIATPSAFTADTTVGSFRVVATAAVLPLGEALFLCTNMLARDPMFDDLLWDFVSPDGEGIGLLVLRGQHGRLMPQMDLYEETVPGVPGYRYLGARHASREINLPCFIEAVNATGIEALRQLARVLDPTKGVGSLRVRTPGGVVRQIGAVYAGGLDAATEENPAGIWCPLVFRTPDPYWTDGIQETTQVGAGFASFELINDGDYETWPVIHLVAGANPIVNPVLVNTAINQRIEVRTGNLGVRDLVVDCRPGYRSAVLDGSPNYGALTIDSELWPMVVGSQVVTFRVDTILNFTTTFTWARRFLSI
jgi:hypothetical protein